MATRHRQIQFLSNSIPLPGEIHCPSVQNHTAVIALVSALVLAGCLGGLTAETEPSDSADVSPEAVPGVANGTLSNASALVEANLNAVTTNGAVLQVNQSAEQMDIDARLAIGANVSTYRLRGTGSASGGDATSIDQWGNETTQLVRTTSNGETNYRVLDEPDDRLTLLRATEEFLSAGEFTVTNETTSDGSVVLTTTNETVSNSSGPAARSLDGRLVVTESGQMQNLSVTITRDGQMVTYSYDVIQAGLESVSKPDWVADIPPGATVQARLSVDVAEGSYLTLQHDSGDVVPSGTAVILESNGTTGTATLKRSLSAGETRYVYFDGESDAPLVTADRPAVSDVSAVSSPLSVRIATDGGAVLHSASMAWESASAGEAATGSSSGAMTTDNTTPTAGQSE